MFAFWASGLQGFKLDGGPGESSKQESHNGDLVVVGDERRVFFKLKQVSLTIHAQSLPSQHVRGLDARFCSSIRPNDAQALLRLEIV